MVFNRKNIKNTIYFSFIVQIVTSFIASKGLFEEVNLEDEILKDILTMELLVQFVESSFYIWVILALKDYNTLTQRRYIDWIITTPTMLISTVIFMRYVEYKENNKKIPSFLEIIEQEKENLIKILIYNWLMLFFGFMGESGKLDKKLSVSVGFVFFYLSFNEIYSYAKQTEKGTNLFNFLLIVWSLYGFSALLENNAKNICYNLLDIVSKNFYGLYIYYIITQVSPQKIGKNGLPDSIISVSE
jgi:bacteriorhodopsin